MTFTIKVTNISWTLAPKDLRRFAREQGRIKDVALLINRATGLSKGQGTITFEDRAAGEKLLGSSNFTLGGRILRFGRYPQDSSNSNDDNSINSRKISDDRSGEEAKTQT